MVKAVRICFNVFMIRMFILLSRLIRCWVKRRNIFSLDGSRTMPLPFGLELQVRTPLISPLNSTIKLQDTVWIKVNDNSILFLIYSPGDFIFTVKNGAQSIFQYGPAVGYKEYLSELSKFLSVEYKEEIVSPDSLVLTCGATNGLHLAATTLMSQNRPHVAFVECPTYFIALNVLKKGTF